LFAWVSVDLKACPPTGGTGITDKTGEMKRIILKAYFIGLGLIFFSLSAAVNRKRNTVISGK